MSGLEQAAGGRIPGRGRTFPREWGDPPANASTEEIAGWASAQIAWGRALRESGVTVRWLRPTTPIDVRAQLSRHRLAAPPAMAARLRLMEIKAKARPWMVDS